MIVSDVFRYYFAELNNEETLDDMKAAISFMCFDYGLPHKVKELTSITDSHFQIVCEKDGTEFTHDITFVNPDISHALTASL